MNTIYRLLEGWRIVEISFLFEQIQSIRHYKFDCFFLAMVFKSECRRGYVSIFTFKCKMCNCKSTLYSERNNQTNSLKINQAIVNGSLAIGML